VRPKGTVAQRKQWYNEAVNIIGKKELTVRYQEKSEDLIPIFPVGIAIRDYE
jgi:DNA ligase-1